MFTLRQVDYGLQFFLACIMLICIPVFYISLAGLFVMGCLQLVSAGLNTRGFIHHGLKKQIRRYWIWTALVLGAILLCFPLSWFFDPDDVQVLACIAVIASVPIAVYYMVIYYRLIEVLKLKRELGGLTKSHH